MAKPGIPHMDYPFRFGSDGHVVPVEQDSEDDILACAIAIMKCPLGFRDELPDFGVREQLFSEGPIDTEEIRVALEVWEERAIPIVTEDEETLYNLVRLIKIQMESARA